MPFLKAKQRIKPLFFELKLHIKRLMTPRRDRVVVIFPSNDTWDPSSNLRAWLIGPELPNYGWRAIVTPASLTLAQRHRILRLEKPDVVLLQQTRHPLNRPRLYPEYACILDADDADYLDPTINHVIAESASEAVAVIGGSRFVKDCMARHNVNAYVLWTSSPKPDIEPHIAQPDRAPIVAWAHSGPLAYPKEAELIQKIISKVARRCKIEFWLFGTAPEMANAYFQPLIKKGAICRALPNMDYDSYLRKVSEAAVGLQPVCTENPFSQGKSFGKLLAYFNGGVAVVATDAVDHPLFIKSGENGFLVANDVDTWVEKICYLLEKPSDRAVIADAGRRDFINRLTSTKFAELLANILEKHARL